MPSYSITDITSMKTISSVISVPFAKKTSGRRQRWITNVILRPELLPQSVYRIKGLGGQGKNALLGVVLQKDWEGQRARWTVGSACG
jgi:hypothetical protein